MPISWIITRLSELLMAPLLDALHTLDVTQATLIPSGYLALLPLHAAWTEQDGHRHYALDRLTLTYAPAARMLAQAQQAAAITDDALLLITEPRPVSASDLPGTNHERNVITALVAQTHPLCHEHATRQAVLDRLPHTPLLHFAGHGGMNWEDPLQSGLLLAHDTVLTVQDVFALNLEHARLAILSACEIGMVGAQLPDEVVMLPTALMYAGFAGVVSTLWSVQDGSTAILMERFYHYWRVEQCSPAEALRQAQHWLRDTTNGEKKAYYEQFIPQYGGQPGVVPEDTATKFRRTFVLEPPHDNRFAHPFYWGGFRGSAVAGPIAIKRL
jgi:CHAT domain-containing protein